MRTVRLLLVLLLALSPCPVPRAAAQTGGGDAVIAPGDPPLTVSLLAKTYFLIEWTLDVTLSEEQRTGIGNALVGYWRANNRAEIEGTVGTARVVDGLTRLGKEERARAREVIRPQLLQALRSDPNDELNRIVLRAYEAAHPADSAAGAPPNGRPSAPRSGLRVGADGFTGVYRMLRPRALDINNLGPEPGYWIEYVTFLPDGHVYWRLPPEGLLYFDPAAAQRAHPEDWGTYEIRGGAIRILRGPGRNPYVMTRSGERLNNPPQLGEGSFRPVPAADGLRLEGNYRRHPSEPTITFTADGRFREGGVFGFFGTLERPDGTTYQDDGVGGTGTYLVEQNTLELRYSDGRVKRFPFLIFPENLAKKPAVDSFILRSEERMTRY